MRILITNDDGIKAEGLLPLVKWAAKYGEVTTVAPLHEQSGKSHGIDIFRPIAVTPYDLCPETTAYAVDSTPADCVRYGIIGLGQTYDLVISGINRGYNIGQDIVYSGTVGAIYEAAAQGVQGMALSTDPNTLSGALEQLDNVFKFFERNNLFGVNNLYNVNIPENPQGIRITRQGMAHYSDEWVDMGNGTYTQVGQFIFENTKNLDLDTDCVMNGYISITPLQSDRTNLTVYKKLAGYLNQ